MSTEHGYVEALDAMRHEAAHYYADHFDWRGHEPPADWTGPKFYPPADRWRLDAWLDKDVPGTGDHVTLATSTGKLRDMTVAGQLVFDVNGQEHRLTGLLAASARRGAAAVRPVPGRDFGQGNVRRRPLPRPATGRRRWHLRPRLQLRLQPVMRLLTGLRLPLPAGRQSASRPGGRGGNEPVSGSELAH